MVWFNSVNRGALNCFYPVVVFEVFRKKGFIVTSQRRVNFLPFRLKPPMRVFRIKPPPMY